MEQYAFPTAPPPAPPPFPSQAGSRALALDVTVANASLALTSAAMPAAPLGDGADAKFAGLLVTATPSGAVTAGGKSVTLSGKPANGAATFDFTRSTVREEGRGGEARYQHLGKP